MATITIDIPNNNISEVMALLEKFDVIILESNLQRIDTLNKDDHKKHSLNQYKTIKNKEFDETTYLLESSANAERILKGIENYNNRGKQL